MYEKLTESLPNKRASWVSAVQIGTTCLRKIGKYTLDNCAQLK